jgi:Glycosyl hydrolase catalytic core
MRVVGLMIAALVVASCAASAVAAPTAKRTVPFTVGFVDEGFTLYGDPDTAFATLNQLGAQVIRVNLYWGGSPWAVAPTTRPADPQNPDDPAYNWTLYDRLDRHAAAAGIQVVFSILFTPPWANGGQARNVAPTNAQDLYNFAYAATVRYSGFWTPAGDTSPLPAVTKWTAWNEPNNPVWLSPQYKRLDGKWRIESAFQYAKICNAVYRGVHAVLISPERGAIPGEQVACGETGPRGNDAPRSTRPEPDPVAFMVAAKQFGLKTFDVWAHHPYPTTGADSPIYRPRASEHAILLGNLVTLLNRLTQLWGQKHVWLDEYGYQTNPPNPSFGVSWAAQAAYMTEAFTIARDNPRIDMMLWFLVRDDTSATGWQSGLMTADGTQKPSFAAFQQQAALTRASR